MGSQNRKHILRGITTGHRYGIKGYDFLGVAERIFVLGQIEGGPAESFGVRPGPLTTIYRKTFSIYRYVLTNTLQVIKEYFTVLNIMNNIKGLCVTLKSNLFRERDKGLYENYRFAHSAHINMGGHGSSFCHFVKSFV